MSNNYDPSQLLNVSLRLINAMILPGPENEELLHVLQILLDPQEGDDVDCAVKEAQKFSDENYEELWKMTNSLKHGKHKEPNALADQAFDLLGELDVYKLSADRLHMFIAMLSVFLNK